MVRILPPRSIIHLFTIDMNLDNGIDMDMYIALALALVIVIDDIDPPIAICTAATNFTTDTDFTTDMDPP